VTWDANETAMSRGARSGGRGLRAVALGGGHGLHATLTALRLLGDVVDDITAVVTVADDGGSSGRLRRELGSLPPGDLRMALCALAAPLTDAASPEADDLWVRVVQHRFGGSGALAGHAVGNLMLAGLMDVLGDAVAALDEMGRLLGARGRVLPMSCDPLTIEAQVTGLDDDQGAVRLIRGQVAVASTPGRVRRGGRRPPRPPPRPGAGAAAPGAPARPLGARAGVARGPPPPPGPPAGGGAATTTARRVVVLNLAPQPGETAGFSPEQHLDVLSQHAPALRVDAVLADEAAVPVPDRLRRAARTMLVPDGTVHLAPVAADDPAAPRHDPAALAAALRPVLVRPDRGAAAGAGERRT